MVETDYWNTCFWFCPHCREDFLEGEIDGGALLLVKSGTDTDSDDIWEEPGELNRDAYLRRNNTEPKVYCSNCETVFNVEFRVADE